MATTSAITKTVVRRIAVHIKKARRLGCHDVGDQYDDDDLYHHHCGRFYHHHYCCYYYCYYDDHYDDDLYYSFTVTAAATMFRLRVTSQ